MMEAEAIEGAHNQALFRRLITSIGQMHNTVFALNDVINLKATLNYEKKELKFAELLQEIKESINEELELTEAQIIEDFSACPTVAYPPLHLKSIMQNLLTNAVKYRDPKKPLKIELRTTKRQGRTCLSVKDNGMGFDASKYTEKIFGLFQRLHTRVEGKGVGMYIIKSILDSHGGSIKVESQPQKGALFIVYLDNENR